MDNRFRIKVTLLLVLLLLLIAAIVFIIGRGLEESYAVPQTRSQTATAAPVSTAAQQQTFVWDQSTQTGQYTQSTQDTQYTQTAQGTQYGYGSTAQDYGQNTVIYTPVPAYTTTPVPTPTPTPSPTPDPQPAGTVLGSGTLVSATGTLLDIHADWTATVADASNVTVSVTVYVDHYQLHNNSFRSLFITLGNDTQSLDTPNITYDVGGAKTSTVLGSATFQVPLERYASKSLGLHVRWNFGGVYGDGRGNSVDLTDITCGGDITISR